MKMLRPWLRPWLQAIERRLPNLGGTTVLAYHLVDGGTASPVDLRGALFERQLDRLQAMADVVALQDLFAKPRGVTQGPARPRVALTFDDAYRNFAERVWPSLHRRKLPATLYVPVDFIEGRGRPPIRGTEGMAPCTWSELRDMQGDGLDVGSHTLGHPNLTRIDARAARDEIVRSRAVLEDKLGARVASFCYPQGKWARRLEPAVRETYDTAVIGRGFKVWPGRTSPHRIPRLPVRRDDTGDILPLLRAPVRLEELAADTVRQLRR